MDLRDLVKLAGIVNPELLNRIDAPAEVEEADGAGFDKATTRPDEEMMDDPMATMGSSADTSLRRYLKAKGDHVTVDEDVYPDHTVDSVSEAYAAFKEGEYDRARYDADETPRGEKKKKVSVKKAPWEKDDDDKEKTDEHSDLDKLRTLSGIPSISEDQGNWEDDEDEDNESSCKYCGGDCPKDEDYACDGYLGDIDGLYEDTIDEADIEENAFNQAAAAAARAGKSDFEFNGKKYKTKMDKATAHQLDDDVQFESKDTFVGINTKTGDFESGLSYEEVTSGRFTHMLPDDTTYFDPDTAEELVGAPDEEMKAMGWKKVMPSKSISESLDYIKKLAGI